MDALADANEHARFLIGTCTIQAENQVKETKLIPRLSDSIQREPSALCSGIR